MSRGDISMNRNRWFSAMTPSFTLFPPSCLRRSPLCCYSLRGHRAVKPTTYDDAWENGRADNQCALDFTRRRRVARRERWASPVCAQVCS